MKKKILFISHMYPTSYDKSSGKVIHEQALSLIKANHEVKVICPVPYTPKIISLVNSKYKDYRKIPKKDIYEGIEIYYPRYLRLPRNLLTSYSGRLMFYGFSKIVGEIKKVFDFDIIHAHFTLPDAYAAMMISEPYNKPLVTTLQATDLDITIKRNIKCKQNVYKALKSSKMVISPTPRLSSQLKNIFDIDSYDIGYGIDVDNVIFDTPVDLQTKYRNMIVILSISRLIDSKGLEYNIKAVNELKKKYTNIIYLIIGDGPKKESLIELVNELGINEYVEFLGGLNHKKAMEYITIATIFSLPSWQETFGLVYLEAMANEKPVIGCKGQGFDGIIKHSENGFLAEPKDTNSIVEIIDFILTNPFLANSIAKEGKHTAINNYTLDKVANSIVNIYRNIYK